MWTEKAICLQGNEKAHSSPRKLRPDLTTISGGPPGPKRADCESHCRIKQRALKPTTLIFLRKPHTTSELWLPSTRATSPKSHGSNRRRRWRRSPIMPAPHNNLGKVCSFLANGDALRSAGGGEPKACARRVPTTNAERTITWAWATSVCSKGWGRESDAPFTKKNV